MNHLNEEQLILYYYGEPDSATDAEEHLSACAQCRAGYRQLQVTLNAMDSAATPEREAAYGAQVWKSIAGRLPARAISRWRQWQPWVQISAVATLVIAAFFAGRFGAPPGAPPLAAGQPDRILLVALGDHLERSQMVLVELSNAEGATDISLEQRAAQDLLDANRLYRQTAQRSGESALSVVLEDLERVLLEIAHSPSQLSAEELDSVRRRLALQGVLFKVRVVGSEVQERVERNETNEESSL